MNRRILSPMRGAKAGRPARPRRHKHGSDLSRSLHRDGEDGGVPYRGGSASRSILPPVQDITPLEQTWNEFRSTFSVLVPVDEVELAAILAEAIRSCSDEMETGEHFEADTAGRTAQAKRHGGSQLVERILVGVCNKSPRGGWLGRQIDEVVKQAGENTPVIVRSTEYPSSPKAAVVQQLGQLIKDGGRKVVVQDSDWRAMMALACSERRREPLLTLQPGSSRRGP